MRLLTYQNARNGADESRVLLAGRAALTAVVAGVPIAHPATQAVGCFIADFAR